MPESEYWLRRGLHVMKLKYLFLRTPFSSSRRQFTPPNHWIMTSQIDVKSFIESVLVEDRAMNEAEDGNGTADVDMNESDDEEAFGRRRIRIHKRNIPSRREMAYVSPRLGVLNNSMYFRATLAVTLLKLISL